MGIFEEFRPLKMIFVLCTGKIQNKKINKLNKVHANKKSVIACKLVINEALKEEEKKGLQSLVDVKTEGELEVIKEKVKEIEIKMKNNTKNPIIELIGVRASPYFVFRTPEGIKY